MSGEKISVIIPCYNVKDMVSECLDSIVAQTIGLEHLEIILIDDASADETVSVLKKYEEKYIVAIHDVGVGPERKCRG